jgi:protein-disulfide isomerase
MASTRRALMIAAALLGLAGHAAAAPPAALPGDMTQGSPKAPIEVIEYASVACPHCAHFSETALAGFKAKWIDTGKARFTLKEMLTGSPTVAMAGFLIARCAGPARYFKVVDDIYRSQSQWVDGQIKPVLQRVAAENGVDEARFNACLQDQGAIEAVNARATRAQEQDGINSTPTLFVNGKRIDDLPQSPAELDAMLTAAAKAPPAKTAAPKKAGGH